MKDRFKMFLVFSAMIHLLALLSFFRVIIPASSEEIAEQPAELEFQQEGILGLLGIRGRHPTIGQHVR